MTAFLVDTNVISELVSTQKDPRVLRFVAENADLWLSTLVIHELRYGVEHMPSGWRRDDLHVSYETLFTQFEDRILPFDRASAEWAARFRIVREREGRSVNLMDALIAGTARANGLAVATRNTTHFDLWDIDVVNPWETN